MRGANRRPLPGSGARSSPARPSTRGRSVPGEAEVVRRSAICSSQLFVPGFEANGHRRGSKRSRCRLEVVHPGPDYQVFSPGDEKENQYQPGRDRLDLAQVGGRGATGLPGAIGPTRPPRTSSSSGCRRRTRRVLSPERPVRRRHRYAVEPGDKDCGSPSAWSSPGRPGQRPGTAGAARAGRASEARHRRSGALGVPRPGAPRRVPITAHQRSWRPPWRRWRRAARPSRR